MPEPVLRQFSAFLLFLLGGIALGFFFDMLRAARALGRPRGAAAFCLDMGFWAVVLMVVFPLLVLGTWGDLRLFVWLAFLAGLVYYSTVLGAIGRSVARGMVRIVLACLGIVVRSKSRVKRRRREA